MEYFISQDLWFCTGFKSKVKRLRFKFDWYYQNVCFVLLYWIILPILSSSSNLSKMYLYIFLKVTVKYSCKNIVIIEKMILENWNTKTKQDKENDSVVNKEIIAKKALRQMREMINN